MQNKNQKTYTPVNLFRFHIDFFADVAEGTGSDLTSPRQEQK